jgi:hypothetical protein
MDGDEVSDSSPEDAHGRGELCVMIRGVSVLQYGALEFVGVKGAMVVSVVSDETFHCLHANLCTAVAVWEGDRGDAMAHAPVTEKGGCCCRCELWSAI